MHLLGTQWCKNILTTMKTHFCTKLTWLVYFLLITVLRILHRIIVSQTMREELLLNLL